MDAEITRSTTCQRLNIRRRLSQRKYFEKVNSLTWCHTGFNATSAQSNEEETHHGQRTECEEEEMNERGAL